MRVYIDADILIWHLRGNEKAVEFFKRLRTERENELWTGVMQRAEVVFFMKPKEEEDTIFFLSQFKTAGVDQEIVDKAASLYRQWHPSHGVDINDTILAATALKTGGKIYCLNKKHYPFGDISVERPW